jgi:uncharacterized protein (DUF1697 family)
MLSKVPARGCGSWGGSDAGGAAMDRRVALLRGINVGRAKRLAMADLRALVEGLGYGDMRTVLNSGNVVFTVPRGRRDDPAARIETALADRLGVAARVTVLTAAELAVAVAGKPLGALADNPSRLLVAVLADPAADRARLEPLAQRDWVPEALALGDRVAYLWCPDGVLAGRLAAAVGRSLGDAVTTRNWATLTKLTALAGEE